jgi:hypothetical protein
LPGTRFVFNQRSGLDTAALLKDRLVLFLGRDLLEDSIPILGRRFDLKLDEATVGLARLIDGREEIPLGLRYGPGCPRNLGK